MEKIKGKIISMNDEFTDVKNFVFKLEDKIDFKPGQHVVIFQENSNFGRTYSITTTPDELPKIGFCIKRYPEGKMTNYLFNKKPGDILEMTKPFGRIYLHNKEKPIVFLASGTGIAPMTSMIKELLKKPLKHTIHLLFGASKEDEIIYNKFFRKLEKENEIFYFIPCISRPTDKWKGRQGYVQNNLDAIPNWVENDFYIMGIPEMVKDTKQVLLDAKIPETQIFIELG